MATFDVGIIITAVNNARGVFRNLDRDLQRTGRSAERTTNKLRAIQVVLAGIAVGAGIQFAKTITQTVGSMELMVERLSRVEGGMKGARDQLDTLIKDFGRTPFAINEVADSFTRLRAAGLSTEDANRTLRAGADAVAAFGGSTAELNRFIIGLQQSIGKGTLSMEELRQQIGEAVPSAMRILAREMDISVAELFRQIETGSVESLDAVRKLTDGLQRDFGGAALQLGGKILGAIQGARANIQKALLDLFAVDTNAATQTVEFIREMEKRVIAFIQSISQSEVDKFFTALRGGAGVVGELVGVLRTLLNLLTDLFNGINGFLGSTGTVIAGSGLIGFLMFGAKGAAVGVLLASTQQIFGDLMSQVRGSKGVVDGILGTLGQAATFGLIGFAIFGKLGPAGIAAAAGTLLTQIGSVVKENAGSQQLADNFRERVFKAVGDRGPEAARDFLLKFINEAKNSSAGATIARTILGREGSFQQGIDEARKLLFELADSGSEAFKRLQVQSDATGKKMEAIAQILNRTTIKISVDLEKLANRTETTTFSFGSQTAEKLRRQLEPMVEETDKLRAKIDKFLADTAGAALTDQQSRALAAARKELASMEKNVQRVNDAISKGTAKATAEFADKVNDSFEKARIGVQRMEQTFDRGRNGGLTAQLLRVDTAFDRIKLRIEEVIEKQRKLGDGEGIQRSLALLAKAVDLRDQEKQRLTEIFNIQKRIADIQEKQNRLQIEQGMTDLRRQNRGVGGSLLQSEFTDEAENRRIQLRGQVLSIQAQIAEKEIEARNASADQKANIEATVSRLREFQGATEAALESTSAAGILAQKTWQDVGQAIQGSAGEALKGVINGTLDAQQVLSSFYDKITDAAINYLIELVKIQLQQSLLGAGSGAGAGGAASGGGGAGGFLGIASQFIGAFFAANGAVAGGSIKPFANGDIIKGPTMFGVAGEAGDEAIMPLTRIGGQLGVRTSGGGGDNFSITIQAIDTQTGAQFLQKNSDTIVNQLRHKSRLNSGIGGNR